MAKASFAAGCFWGVQEDFEVLKEITKSIVGYTGGVMKNPSYEDVLTDTTGHAEAVQLSFNEDELPYEALLQKFFELHNPSAMPGNTYKYRSTIFYHTLAQKQKAERFLEDIKRLKLYKLSVKTEIVPAKIFYKAESYHQHYYQKQKKS